MVKKEINKKIRASTEFAEQNKKELEEEYKEWDKWRCGDFEYLVKKKCVHFGEVNIFGLAPISCHDINVDNINKLIKEKNIKSWLILDLGCLIGIDIDKLSNINIYFNPVRDFSVPSFEEMNNIIEFISKSMDIDKGNVLVSCIDGHGRTGLVLAVWAGINGIENPVKYIREIYCVNAVETITQEMLVNIYLKYIKNL
jgi:protein-tyrosine phosphatase